MSILRHVRIEQRNRLEGREEKNSAIYDRFFKTFPEPGRVFIYVDFRAEVETRKIIATLLERGIPVAAPKMFGLAEKQEEIWLPDAPTPSARTS